MNNFSKMIVNIVANSKDEVTLIPNYSGGFIRKDIELVKFLSYVVNLKYDRIFVSLLNFNPNEFNQLKMRDIIYVFHNEEFTQEEIAKLQLLNKKLNKN